MTTKLDFKKYALQRVAMLAAFVVTFVIVTPIAKHFVDEHRARNAATMQRDAEEVQRSTEAARRDDFSAKRRDLDARLQTFIFKYDCTTDGAHWFRDHPRDFPRHMVLQPVNAAGQWTWDLEIKPWSMDKKDIAGGAVKLLCLK